MKKRIETKKILLLRDGDSGLHNLIVRVHGTHINSSFKRRDPVVICNTQNKKKIIRYVLGGGSLPGLTKDSLAIDYDGLETLGFKMKKQQVANLIVRKPKVFEKYLFFIQHPDLSTSLSIRLGLLGAFLGFLGLILGITSLFN